MKRENPLMRVPRALLAVVCCCGTEDANASQQTADVVATPEVHPEVEAVVAEINRLGGHVERDLTHADRPVVSIAFPPYGRYGKVRNADLAILKGLTRLRKLKLSLSKTDVNDAGLEHLKGLTQLEELWLSSIGVTDAGVEKLQQTLPNCYIDH